jgi:hypothetical protein
VASLGFHANDVANKEARLQMGIPAEPTQLFPDLWKTNYILPERILTPTTYGNQIWCYHCQKHGDHVGNDCPNKGKHRKSKGLASTVNTGTNEWWDAKTIDELFEEAEARKIDDAEVLQIVQELGGPESTNREFYDKIMDICGDNYIKLDRLFELVVQHLLEKDKKTTTVDESGKPTINNEEMTEGEVEYYMGFRQGVD